MDKLRKLDSTRIEITADSHSRAINTGHPRLLSNVLKGTVNNGVMAGVEITAITHSQWEGYSEWSE